MHINAKNVLIVIFVLSTIVTLTDCCSSRILRLKDHTLKYIRYQAQQQQQQESEQYQMEQAKELLPSQNNAGELLEVAKNFTNVDITATYKLITSTATTKTISSTQKPLTVQASVHALDLNASEHASSDQRSTTTTIDYVDYVPAGNNASSPLVTDYAGDIDNDAVDVTDSSFDADAAVREQHAGKAKYHVLDLYYYIMRDVLSFECTGQYLTDFCLNGGRCFRYPVGNHSFFSCECADGYIGERCESKSLSDFPVTPAALKSTRRPSKVRTAHIFFSFPMLIFLSVIYLLLGALIVFRRPKKERAAGLLED